MSQGPNEPYESDPYTNEPKQEERPRLVAPPPPDWDPDAVEERRRIPWKRVFLWMLGAIVGMFLIVLLLDKVVMPWYVNLGAQAKVPDVVGLPFEPAEDSLRKAGFEVLRDEPMYSEEVPAGVIIRQLPYGGAMTKEGRRIYLTESRGVELTSMPPLTGRPLREARITLMRAGFEIGEIVYENNDTIMRDLVFSQSVPAGVGTRPGTEIDLMMSKGPETKYAMMPNLVGLTLDEAASRLGNAGLTLGVVRRKRSSFDRNIVIDQSAAPYGKVSERGAINVTVSDPDAPVAVTEPEEEVESDGADEAADESE